MNMVYYTTCVLGILSLLYLIKQLCVDPETKGNFERRLVGLMLTMTIGFGALIWTLEKDDERVYNNCIEEQTVYAQMLRNNNYNVNDIEMKSPEQFAKWACDHDFDIKILVEVEN